MYRHAVLSIALVAAVVMTAGGAALAILSDSASDTTPAAIAPDDTLFEVGEAGTVTVRSDGTTVRVTDVTAAAGWGHRIARGSGPSVDVLFTTSSMGIDFEAALDEGTVVGKIRIVSADPSGDRPDTDAVDSGGVTPEG